MTSATLRNSFLALSLSLLAGCKDIPKWDGKIFVGDSERQVITRVDVVDGVEIRTDIATSDPRFNGAVVFKGESFKSFWETYILRCKEWEEGPMIPSEQALIELSRQDALIAGH